MKPVHISFLVGVVLTLAIYPFASELARNGVSDENGVVTTKVDFTKVKSNAMSSGDIKEVWTAFKLARALYGEYSPIALEVYNYRELYPEMFEAYRIRLEGRELTGAAKERNDQEARLAHHKFLEWQVEQGFSVSNTSGRSDVKSIRAQILGNEAGARNNMPGYEAIKEYLETKI